MDTLRQEVAGKAMGSGTKAYELLSAGFSNPDRESTFRSRFKPLIDYYKEITGIEETMERLQVAGLEAFSV